MKRNAKTVFLCQGAIIAALYVVLTYAVKIFGLDSGVIQVRVSEMLCILPIFTPAAIPGLYLGCLLSNLLAGAVWLDIVVGPIATLIGALGTYFLRKLPIVATLPPVAANALIVPFVRAYGDGVEEAIQLFMLSGGIGELISVCVLGTGLYFSLKKHENRIFKLK